MVDDFMAALNAGGPPPRWATMADGPNPPEVRDTTSATLSLEPGSYADHDMAKKITVAGEV